jgi:hypothetical protein
MEKWLNSYGKPAKIQARESQEQPVRLEIQIAENPN